YLLKGAGTFHPSYYYPDVRNHRRYVDAFAEADGSLAERGVAAQMKVRTAYPRRVGDKVYAFPYSPVFFIPFTWLPQDRDLVEQALKHVALAAAAAEVVVVYWLAGACFGPASGVFAAWLAAFFPAMYSRLFLAMWPTITGHLLDILAIGSAMAIAARPPSLTRLAAFGACMLASFLTYVSSLFNLSAFTAFFSLLEQRVALRTVALWAGATVATVSLLYFSFTITFLSEILPALLSSGLPPGRASLASNLFLSLQRLPQFYGYGTLALAVAGFVLARRQSPPSTFRSLLAYGLSFLMLLVLRGASGGLFKDLKEIIYVGPLIAVTAGASLETLAARGRPERWAAWLILCGIIIFWAGQYREYLAAYASLAAVNPLN
ncbi:MAG: hypothetical protein ACE5JI_17150, partial [Acidobacteriota bacterium]